MNTNVPVCPHCGRVRCICPPRWLGRFFAALITITLGLTGWEVYALAAGQHYAALGAAGGLFVAGLLARLYIETRAPSG